MTPQANVSAHKDTFAMSPDEEEPYPEQDRHRDEKALSMLSARDVQEDMEDTGDSVADVVVDFMREEAKGRNVYPESQVFHVGMAYATKPQMKSARGKEYTIVSFSVIGFSTYEQRQIYKEVRKASWRE